MYLNLQRTRVSLYIVLILCSLSLSFRVLAYQSSSRSVVAWDFRGSLVAFGYSDESIELWNWETEESLFQLQIPDLRPPFLSALNEMTISDIAFDPSTNTIAVSFNSNFNMGLIIFVNIQSQTITAQTQPVADINAVAWNSTGTRIAAAYVYNRLTTGSSYLGIWDVLSGQQLSEQPIEYPHSVSNIDWNPTTGQIAVDTSHEILIVDDSTLNEQYRIPILGGAGITSLEWNPDGSQLLTAASDGRVQIFDAQTASLVRTLQSGSSDVRVLPTVFWGGGGIRAGSYDLNTIRVWDSQSGTLLQTYMSPFRVAGVIIENNDTLILGMSGEMNDAVLDVVLPTPTPTPVLNTVILSPTPANPLTLSEETRAWYTYTITLSAPLTGSESVTVRLDYYPPTPSNYAHVQTRPKRPAGQEVSWTTAQTLVFDANHTEYEVRIRARDDSTNHTGAVGRLSHRITASNVAGYAVNTVDSGGTRLTGSPFNGGNDASAAADSRNVLVFTVTDND